MPKKKRRYSTETLRLQALKIVVPPSVARSRKRRLPAGGIPRGAKTPLDKKQAVLKLIEYFESPEH